MSTCSAGSRPAVRRCSRISTGATRAGSTISHSSGWVIAMMCVLTRRLYRYANRGAYIAFAAPGVDIQVPREKDDDVSMSGTSFATPYVTALLAVRRQLHPLTAWRDLVKALIGFRGGFGGVGARSVMWLRSAAGATGTPTELRRALQGFARCVFRIPVVGVVRLTRR
jgi:subtilisin family serine protease